MAFVELQNFSLCIHGRSLLKNIDLSLDKEKVGLVGQSGSGKSLLARSLIYMNPPSAKVYAQKYCVRGIELQKAAPSQLHEIRRKWISYVPQDAKLALNPLRKVGAQLEEIPSTESILESLEKMHFPSPKRVLNLYPYQLSGGMASRVVLAMMMRSNPKFLIADEGLSSLDTPLQEKMLHLLQEAVASSDRGLLFITHNLAHAKRLCEMIIVMQNGEIVAKGSFSQLQSSSHPYVQALLESCYASCS